MNKVIKNLYVRILFVFLIFINILVSCDSIFSFQNIDLTNDKIEILGCLHVKRYSDKIIMSRFSDANLLIPDLNFSSHGQTQTGVIIRFTTNSDYVKVKFVESNGVHKGIEYGVWIDGVWYKSFSKHSFTLYKPKGKNFGTWEITPSLNNSVFLSKIEINDSAQIIQCNLPKLPNYFAFGNSISQGIGQGNAGYKSYPFIFGRKMGYETFNLAIGGSLICNQVGTELIDQKADLITVLWGFNDWYYYGKTAQNYRNLMLDLLKNIRKYQPKTPLICISLIGTEKPTPPSGVTIEEYRSVLKQLVLELRNNGDKNIYLLDGANVNIELSDKIHPSVNGATEMAEILEQFVKENIPNN